MGRVEKKKKKQLMSATWRNMESKLLKKEFTKKKEQEKGRKSVKGRLGRGTEGTGFTPMGKAIF